MRLMCFAWLGATVAMGGEGGLTWKQTEHLLALSRHWRFLLPMAVLLIVAGLVALTGRRHVTKEAPNDQHTTPPLPVSPPLSPPETRKIPTAPLSVLRTWYARGPACMSVHRADEWKCGIAELRLRDRRLAKWMESKGAGEDFRIPAQAGAPRAAGIRTEGPGKKRSA
ncbi:MAG: hypothetical protein NTW87_00325 [Planctomycetota bacterium]|nr:hypothetical protein [Planctomycetota bacterium]